MAYSTDNFSAPNECNLQLQQNHNIIFQNAEYDQEFWEIWSYSKHNSNQLAKLLHVANRAAQCYDTEGLRQICRIVWEL